MDDINAAMRWIFGRPMWFDKRGRPLELTEYAELADLACYSQVRAHDLPGYFVVTEWIGFNMALTPPGVVALEIFETRIYADDRFTRGLWRYSTEMEAVAGHYEVVHGLLAELGLSRRVLSPYYAITGWNRYKALEA